MQCPQLFVQRHKARTSEGREIVGWIIDESGEVTQQRADLLRKGHSVFC